ncbi:Slp family lipoprotein [Vibrio sinaloensis]|uniref:Slp family lipoprotein n=1 Tax=Photobacterium sp. (strain ATCC 43367) TaxID=379097 RepID=UPI00057F045A|nr:Slp family lipoprotein [Vibrio sinaloensis]KHT45838.1 starvation-inducible protein [Vibrio sinaloensis]
MTIFSRSLFVTISLFLLSACSTLPENLKSEDPQLVSDYTVWQSKPTASGNVRLGGVIAKVTNLQSKTRVEVVNLPISSNGKPDISQEPQGRFVGYIDGYAEPASLAQGRLITLLGQSIGAEQGAVGDYEYAFPVMKVQGFHLWRIEERVRIQEVDSYLYPCRGLYCREMRHSSRQGTVIQEVK